MGLLELVLNVVLPPSAALSLVLLWPLLTILDVFRWMFSWLVHENVRGKVILITGSSSGIGEHMAYEYARRGARLVLVARREDQLRAVADRAITKGASDVHVLVGDMTKEDDCKSVIDATIHKYGRLDHLINNAGNNNSFFFEDTQDTKALTAVVDTDFWGPVYMTYFALPHLRRTYGKILVTASVGSYIAFPRESIYNGAKAGILQFFDTLRVEAGDTVGITVLMPGFTESEGTRGKMINENGEMIFNQKKRDEHFGPSPMAFTEEVAKAAVKGMLRGQRYVIVPFYYSVFLLYRVFAPEVMEWMFRFGFVSHPEKPRSKQALEATNAQKVLYPKSTLKGE
ncbi:hypothetical protein KC19_10G043700 [Ceratodon purpureus]|uniref:Uncharacterized protein n=2 Tax=Ceratodon purpureus TaxID=3225 RepID=A0A8T0GI06_CERPU|nr:hypothetical protein KC19_10G043700 [Ceratodon purpureus]